MSEHFQLKLNIIHALKSSSQSSNQEQKNENVNVKFLNENSTTQGYPKTLMEIANDEDNKEEIRLAVLTELMVTLRKSSGKNEQFDKFKLREFFIPSMIRYSKNHRFIKILKKVIYFSILKDKTWFPQQGIVQKIHTDEDIVPMLHLAMTIVQSSVHVMEQEEKYRLFKFIHEALFELRLLRQRNNNPEITYLIAKFLFKTYSNDLNDKKYKIILEWIDFIEEILTSSNPDFYNYIIQPETKGTPEFFYFHSKKWATMTLWKIFFSYTRRQIPQISQKINEFCQQWSQNSYKRFSRILMNQLLIPTITNVRVWQFECIKVLVNKRSEEIKRCAKYFQEDILTRYIRSTPEDQEKAKTQPLEFFKRQNDFKNRDNKYLKCAAKDLWIQFFALESEGDIINTNFNLIPGPLFNDNILYLQRKLQSRNPIDRQMAMYLICKLKTAMINCKQFTSLVVPYWMEKFIIHELSSEFMLLRARALEFFQLYGQIENFTPEIIQQATQKIYNCLTNDHYTLIRMKASVAFGKIIQHKCSSQLLNLQIQNIFDVHFDLVEKYQLWTIAYSFKQVVKGFSQYTEPFAIDLSQKLIKAFMKLFHEEEKAPQMHWYCRQDNQAPLYAQDYLQILTQVIANNLSQQTLIKLQPAIIFLLEIIFSTKNTTYIMKVMNLLTQYIHQVKVISKEIFFYYQIVIYYVAGIPKQSLKLIPDLPISQNQKNILNNIKDTQNLGMLDSAMFILRIFIYKKLNSIICNKGLFEKNLLQLFLYMVQKIYKVGPYEDVNDYNFEMSFCTFLFNCMLENMTVDLPMQFYIQVLIYLDQNIQWKEENQLLYYNSQLEALLIWSIPKMVLDYVKNYHIQNQFMNSLLDFEKYQKNSHKRKRMVIGLCSLIQFEEKPSFVTDKYYEIIEILIKLVNLNAQERIAKVKNPTLIPTKIVEQENQNQIGVEIGQDFVNQLYDPKYKSHLDEIDEIEMFEPLLRQIQAGENQTYNNLPNKISHEELFKLSDIIQKAKSLAPLKCSDELPKIIRIIVVRK